MDELIETLQDELSEIIAAIANTMLREHQFIEINNKISVAIGMRRTGKTNLMLTKIKQLLNNNIPLTRILYLDFEDDRLLPLSQKKLTDLIETFYSHYPNNHHETCFLFLDEIQNVDGWALVIRRIFRSKKTKIYLTGSSAKLLSKEIATALRGRSISTEVWPLSFSEFLHTRVKSLPSFLKSKKTRDYLCQHLNDYMHTGGFPEVILESEINRGKILQDYIQTVLFRDIVERHDITNITALRYMIHYLLLNTATNLSTNKLFNDLKSQSFHIGRTTVYDYLSYIEDAYLIFRVPLYSESVRVSQSNPQKIYAIDTALVNASRLKRIDNKGRYLENLVYLELRRMGHEIYYYLTKERHEVDFFTKSLDGKLHLYQVTWDMKAVHTHQREMRALQEAEKELDIRGQIITSENFAEWALSHSKLYANQ